MQENQENLNKVVEETKNESVENVKVENNVNREKEVKVERKFNYVKKEYYDQSDIETLLNDYSKYTNSLYNGDKLVDKLNNLGTTLKSVELERDSFKNEIELLKNQVGEYQKKELLYKFDKLSAGKLNDGAGEYVFKEFINNNWEFNEETLNNFLETKPFFKKVESPINSNKTIPLSSNQGVIENIKGDNGKNDKASIEQMFREIKW